MKIKMLLSNLVYSRERNRRYSIMREHGLITVNRTLSWISKYSEALGGNSDQTIRSGLVYGGRFISLMQLTSGTSFDLIVESLQYAHDVRKYLFRFVADTQRFSIQNLN